MAPCICCTRLRMNNRSGTLNARVNVSMTVQADTQLIFLGYGKQLHNMNHIYKS